MRVDDDGRAQDFIDGRMSPSEAAEFRERLARDDSLRRRVEGYRELRAALREERESTLPPGFHARARARFESRHRPRARIPWEAVGLATAALIVAAVFVPGWLRDETPPGGWNEGVPGAVRPPADGSGARPRAEDAGDGRSVVGADDRPAEADGKRQTDSEPLESSRPEGTVARAAPADEAFAPSPPPREAPAAELDRDRPATPDPATGPTRATADRAAAAPKTDEPGSSAETRDEPAAEHRTLVRQAPDVETDRNVREAPAREDATGSALKRADADAAFALQDEPSYGARPAPAEGYERATTEPWTPRVVELPARVVAAGELRVIDDRTDWLELLDDPEGSALAAAEPVQGFRVAVIGPRDPRLDCGRVTVVTSGNRHLLRLPRSARPDPPVACAVYLPADGREVEVE